MYSWHSKQLRASPRDAKAFEFRWSMRVEHTGLENDLQRYTQKAFRTIRNA